MTSFIHGFLTIPHESINRMNFSVIGREVFHSINFLTVRREFSNAMYLQPYLVIKKIHHMNFLTFPHELLNLVNLQHGFPHS